MINQYCNLLGKTWEKYIPKSLASVLFLLLVPAVLAAQDPVIRVDLDQYGRSEKEVNKLGYQYWPVKETSELSRTFNGVDITFTRTGNAGTGLTSHWYKVGIQEPYYARLINDGLIVQEGDEG